jgi:hypothetical protein
MEVEYKGMAWLNLTQNMIQWWAFVKTAVIFRVV